MRKRRNHIPIQMTSDFFNSLLEDEARSRDDPVLSIIRKRQYADWRIFRHLPANMPEVSQSIDRFCGDIAKALRAHRLTPEEREAERFRLAAEEEHHQKEVAEARKSADGEARTQRLLAEDRKPLAKEAADSKSLTQKPTREQGV